ncbi:universal stress protein [Natronorubrum texcoconense]|uniref:Nucleotide-binding universal stress protein, UspA family n=1 Tax=Natronorubrum texcoconense TaxID=1095776 RepID=A0A1G9D817_9EURY|nr:universal stress protein [Natronorubrum texcoconense]SDK60047.1 Nucleotide-binding universal stress protein, UspA family [Natronorubrum texcoconense]
MTTILVSIDTDVTRAKEQVESITSLPLQTDETDLVLYHVFRADGEGADARNLKSVSVALDSLEEAGFDVEIRQSSGDAVRNILDEAEALDADVISLAGRKRSPTGKALFGSVAQDVILRSDRTVLLDTTDN